MASVKEDIYEHISAVYQTASDEIKSWISTLKENNIEFIRNVLERQIIYKGREG